MLLAALSQWIGRRIRTLIDHFLVTSSTTSHLGPVKMPMKIPTPREYFSARVTRVRAAMHVSVVVEGHGVPKHLHALGARVQL